MITQTTLVLVAACCCLGQERILWNDPGDIDRIDFALAAHSAGISSPRPPFNFIGESLKGTSPKILVRDASGVKWRIKGGYEVNSESFVTRLVAAVGYYASPTWYVPSGKVAGSTSLDRARAFIQTDGSFSRGSFERRDADLKKLSQDWIWSRNPFIGTREFNGLKTMMMLVSNWDNKDARNRRIGSNTAISERRSGNHVQLIYYVSDWGQTMGAWGAELKPKGWDCHQFALQTASFVQGLDGKYVRFGYIGQHTQDFKSDVSVADVRWLLQYLGRVSESQIHLGLIQSGASPEEAVCFGTNLRERVRQLQRVVQDSRL